MHAAGNPISSGRISVEDQEPGNLVRNLVSTVRRSARMRTVQITLYGHDGQAVLHAVDPPGICASGGAGQAADSPARLVWRARQPLLVSTAADSSRFPQYTAWMREVGLQAEWVIPIMLADRCVGAIGFGPLNGHPRTQSDFEGILAAEKGCFESLERILRLQEARSAHQELAHERDRWRLLLEINNALVCHLDLESLWNAIAECLPRIVPHERSGILLYDSQQRVLRELGAGRHGGLFSEESIPIDDFAIETAFPAGKPLVLGAKGIAHFQGAILRRFFAEKSSGSGCLLPLRSHNEHLGVLGLVSRRQGAFGPEQVSILAGVAAQISIAVENARAHQELESLKNQLSAEKQYLDEEARAACDFDLIGSSEAFLRVLSQVEMAAPTDSTVLIQGETGSGKEVVARAIHQLSRRRERTLVKVNCSAIPTGLLESEFFGHEKGSFTGAIARRIGRFEIAHQGTLFLDEVGDIPRELQPKLLRVLQEREFERIGGTRTIQVDVRLVAATNADLAELVAGKQFRSDLYYRLNVFPITVPPLRERPKDILPLAQRFAQSFAQKLKKPLESIPLHVQEALIRYPWPGNIRELQNVIERAVILSRGTALEVSLPEPKRDLGDTTLASAEREYIIRTLGETNWVLSGRNGAASRLGLNRSTLQSRMRKLGIRRPGPA